MKPRSEWPHISRGGLLFVGTTQILGDEVLFVTLRDKNNAEIILAKWESFVLTSARAVLAFAVHRPEASRGGSFSILI